MTQWKKKKAPAPALPWIIKHGTRTLIKKGHAGALALQGVHAVAFKRTEITLRRSNLRIGETLDITVTLKNPAKKPLSVMIDIEIGFLKSTGRLSPKIFKGRSITLLPEEKRVVELRLPIKPVTTRTYYPGKQSCTLLINGQRQKPLSFGLKV